MAKKSTQNEAVSPAELRKLYRAARREAHASLEEKLGASMERRRALTSSQREAAAIAQRAMRRSLESDEESRESMRSLVTTSADDLLLLEPAAERLTSPLSKDAAVGLVSGSGIRGITNESPMMMTMAKDTTVQVFVAPYDDDWSNFDGGGRRHLQGKVWAVRNSGRFGLLYTIGKEGGSVTCGAAIWVHFMRQSPGSPPGMGPSGMAQVRTYTPYGYTWRDHSYLATAHQFAGFGIFVVSSDVGGGDRRVDQDHEYWAWSDGTSWYDNHTNPSFSGRDYDVALQYGNMAPYFPIEPGRMYAAAIWTFAGADASGASLVDASYAQAVVEATARLVAVGQQ